jgi:hypothetical protein
MRPTNKYRRNRSRKHVWENEGSVLGQTHMTNRYATRFRHPEGNSLLPSGESIAEPSEKRKGVFTPPPAMSLQHGEYISDS